MEEKGLRTARLLLRTGTWVGLLWLSARFLLPWAGPFLLAFALAALMEPPVRWLVRHGWRRSAAAGLVTLALLALLLRGLWALAARGSAAVTDFAGRAPELVEALALRIRQVENAVVGAASRVPEGSKAYLQAALDSLGKALSELPSLLSQRALEGLGRIAQASPDLLLFAVTAGIGTYFFSASFPRVLAFLSAQLPEDLRRRLSGLERDLKGSFGGFLRAQLLLMLMTFGELLLAFLLLRVDSPLTMAAVTALVDALPVFGTGTVLLPWALYELLLGESGLALGLLLCWALVNLLRSCVQAKLLGDQIGLDPLASLLAIYVGWRVCGIWGMLLFPLLLVTLGQLNDKGILHLWNSP